MIEHKRKHKIASALAMDDIRVIPVRRRKNHAEGSPVAELAESLKLAVAAELAESLTLATALRLVQLGFETPESLEWLVWQNHNRGQIFVVVDFKGLTPEQRLFYTNYMTGKPLERPTSYTPLKLLGGCVVLRRLPGYDLPFEKHVEVSALKALNLDEGCVELSSLFLNVKQDGLTFMFPLMVAIFRELAAGNRVFSTFNEIMLRMLVNLYGIEGIERLLESPEFPFTRTVNGKTTRFPPCQIHWEALLAAHGSKLG